MISAALGERWGLGDSRGEEASRKAEKEPENRGKRHIVWLGV